MFDRIAAIVGASNLLTGAEAEPYAWDWNRVFHAAPLAVARPGSTEEVAALVRLANETGTPLVPASGRTGLNGGAVGEGALIVSLERMNRIREIRPGARSAVVEAGVILSRLHDAVEAENLLFPLYFGARGSAMIGGVLSTNAGGSNVLRYGNTRDLVLGIEAVLPTGEIVNLMYDLHKNNSGYDLRHLLIGAEGTLGIITAAVVKLHPKPRAHATALIGMDSLAPALDLLNDLQEATGGAVEACEYMSEGFFENFRRLRPGATIPLEKIWPVNILIEVGATSPRDCERGPDGTLPIAAHLETTLTRMLEEERVTDAVIAGSLAQRAAMWEIREAAAEVALLKKPGLTLDIAVPVDRVADFVARADVAMQQIDPGAETWQVAHLGDGNVHYSIWYSRDDAALKDRLLEEAEGIAIDLGGSFSAEHGIGVLKLGTMRRRKDPAALAAMRAIKAALDPNGIMNPGKLLPQAG